MITLCTHPDCDADAGVTLQRQVDVAPVPYCLQHAAQQEELYRLTLQSCTRVVIAAQEPTELERAQARVAELEGGGAGELEQQLATALRTLEQQHNALEALRSQLGESRQAFEVAQRELERVKAERTRLQGDLTMATRALELARSGKPPEPTPATPATPRTDPPTRPDGSKP